MMTKSLSCFILLSLGVVSICKAQKKPPPDNSVTIYQQLNIPITISEVLDLTISPSTTMSFDFTSTALIDAGIAKLPAHTLVFKSNKDWYITIKATGSGSNFSGGDQNIPMDLSFLKYKLSTSGTYIPLSSSPQALTGSATSKNPRGTGTILVDFLMDPRYVNNPADDYSVTITYTIASQ